MRRRRLKWLILALAAALIALAATGVTHSRRTLRNSEIDALCKALVDNPPAVSDEAAARLAAIEDPSGIRRVAVNAGTWDFRIGQRLGSILASMGARAAPPICSVWRSAARPANPAPYVWDNPRLERLYAAWLGLPKGTRVRQWAGPADKHLYSALVRMGRPAKPELLRIIAAGDPEMKPRALDALVAIGDPRDLPLFLRMLDDPDPKVAWRGVRGLGMLEPATGFHAGNRYAEDTDAWQAYAAARGRIVESLIKALGRKDTFAPDTVALVLGAYKDNPAAMDAVFTAIYDTSRRRDVREGALLGIARSTDPRALKAFDDMTRDADARVRELAVWCLPQDVATAARVAPLLDSTDAALQQEAFRYFAETERPEILRFIADAFPSFSPAGRKVAVSVLTVVQDGSFAPPSDAPDAVALRVALRQAALDALARIQPASVPASPSLDSSAPAE